VINEHRDGKDLEGDFVAKNVSSKERRKLGWMATRRAESLAKIWNDFLPNSNLQSYPRQV